MVGGSWNLGDAGGRGGVEGTVIRGVDAPPRVRPFAGRTAHFMFDWSFWLPKLLHMCADYLVPSSVMLHPCASPLPPPPTRPAFPRRRAATYNSSSMFESSISFQGRRFLRFTSSVGE